MKLDSNRIDMTNAVPPEVEKALYILGHYLAKTAPDLEADINVTEGDEVINYVIEMREVRRFPWLVDVEK